MRNKLFLLLLILSHQSFSRPFVDELPFGVPIDLSDSDFSLYWDNFYDYEYLRDKKDYEKALTCLDRALELSKDDYSLWMRRGLLNYYISCEEALIDFDQALDLNPPQNEAAKIYFYKANIYNQMDDANKTLSMIKIAAYMGHRKAIELLHSFRINQYYGKNAKRKVKSLISSKIVGFGAL